MKEERTNENKEPIIKRITDIDGNLLAATFSNEGNLSLPVDLAMDLLRFLQYDLASQLDKLSAVEVVEVSMHGLTCQRMSRMSVNVNVVSIGSDIKMK